MNERIKELEKQSYITFKDENSFRRYIYYIAPMSSGIALVGVVFLFVLMYFLK